MEFVMSLLGLGRVKTLRWADRKLGRLVTCEGCSALAMPWSRPSAA